MLGHSHFAKEIAGPNGRAKRALVANCYGVYEIPHAQLQAPQTLRTNAALISAEDRNTKTGRQVGSTSKMGRNERGMNDLVLA
jgi:hypothetical protein